MRNLPTPRWHSKNSRTAPFCSLGAIYFWETERRDSFDPDPLYRLGDWSTENRFWKQSFTKVKWQPRNQSFFYLGAGTSWVTHPVIHTHYVFGISSAVMDGATGLLSSPNETFKIKIEVKTTLGLGSGCRPFRQSSNYPWPPTPDDLDQPIVMQCWHLCEWRAHEYIWT